MSEFSLWFFSCDFASPSSKTKWHTSKILSTWQRSWTTGPQSCEKWISILYKSLSQCCSEDRRQTWLFCDVQLRLRARVQGFLTHFKILRNSYWENAMYSQLTLHDASNLICTSTGKNSLTTHIVSFFGYNLVLITVQAGLHETQNGFNYKYGPRSNWENEEILGRRHNNRSVLFDWPE